MAKIVEAQIYPTEVPLTTTFSTSNKTVTAARNVVVHLVSDEGVSGWGEAPLNQSFTGETHASAAAALSQVLDERVLTHELDSVLGGSAQLHRRLGNGIAARCALSIALWDLHARSLGAPLHKLFGGTRRSRIPVVYHLGNFDLERDRDEAAEAAAEGFQILKLKVGRADVTADLEAVRAVREAVGSAVRIYVDANQAWSRGQAAAFVDHAHELGVGLVEQPVAAWDMAGLAALSATPGVTVGADESVFDAPRLLSALTAGTVPGGVVVKLLKAGGVEGVRELVDLARLAGVRPLLAGMCGDTSIVSAAMLHIALTVDDLGLGTAVTPHFSREDVVDEPLRVVDGHLQLDALSGPGLGISVDAERVRALVVASDSEVRLRA